MGRAIRKRVFGQWRPRSAGSFSQSDQGIRCPLTKSLDTTNISLESKCPDETACAGRFWICVYLHMFEDTFSIDVAHLITVVLTQSLVWPGIHMLSIRVILPVKREIICFWPSMCVCVWRWGGGGGGLGGGCVRACVCMCMCVCVSFIHLFVLFIICLLVL